MGHRALLGGSGTALCFRSPLGRAKLFAYVGTYTEELEAGAVAEGIYLFEMDQATGETLRYRMFAL